MRDRIGNHAAPTARCRNCLRWGSSMVALPEVVLRHQSTSELPLLVNVSAKPLSWSWFTPAFEYPKNDARSKPSGVVHKEVIELSHGPITLIHECSHGLGRAASWPSSQAAGPQCSADGGAMRQHGK